MIVSSHKNLQCLALHSRVCDDKKLMMDLKFTDSLLKPEAARELCEITDEQAKPMENNSEPVPIKNLIYFKLLADAQDDQELVMAATQVENKLAST